MLILRHNPLSTRKQGAISQCDIAASTISHNNKSLISSPAPPTTNSPNRHWSQAAVHDDRGRFAGRLSHGSDAFSLVIGAHNRPSQVSQRQMHSCLCGVYIFKHSRVWRGSRTYDWLFARLSPSHKRACARRLNKCIRAERICARNKQNLGAVQNSSARAINGRDCVRAWHPQNAHTHAISVALCFSKWHRCARAPTPSSSPYTESDTNRSC